MTRHNRPKPRNPLKGSHKDREQARVVLDTPQTRSPAYRLAFDDQDFLCSPEMRGVRLQLEMMKTETMLQEAGIVSTTVLFGGARIPAPGEDPWAAKNDVQRRNLDRVQQILHRSPRICPPRQPRVGEDGLHRICGRDRRRPGRDGSRVAGCGR